MSEIVDLSKLPAPQVLEELDYEQLLAERKAKFISFYPDEEQPIIAARLELESEPIVKLLEENCYLQLLERQRINNAAKATMLAYATGTDLDVIAANFNVKRLVIQAEDLNANPPKAEILESDEDFRLRTQLAFEGLSVAGPRSAYVFHALNAHSDVADVSVESPSPAHVTVTVLSRNTETQGVPDETVLNAVRTKLNEDDIRPVADRVTVQAVQIQPYQVQATLYLLRGPEAEPIKKQAEANLQAYAKANRRLGRDITLSGIYACLHIEGVQRVVLQQPQSDILLPSHKAGFCTNIKLTTAISDDY
ncbi:baseplate J/gp47 family protein [Actinobacillus equuli subsp. haemolyticus]|uniref:baseplate J/gp47 family protein n=1 Tax=Actinobacillus equuli TaxID=718 RepID=UPI0024189ED8|nr:baseplate J/gp47 family protein [Actinobacillus equuli]MDG4948721.1 baseplate J/gp47 family protein [Actinobacillus equuli subsp. haemolyticus]WGE63786.1 baseplate J/gp47 family protein [Actinobacillus equuli subsp. haemolyticus]